MTGERTGRAESTSAPTHIGRSLATKTRLLDAGERLFAERGIDNVSLREITRSSGARNAVALQHHFGDRDGLLAGVLARHQPFIDHDRAAALDAIADPKKPVPRDLAEALVRPLAGRLESSSGRAFLQIYADLINRPRPIITHNVTELTDSIVRWRAIAEVVLPPGGAQLHRRFSAILYTSVELARCAREERARHRSLRINAIVDLAEAVLTWPVSPSTAALLAERERRAVPE